MRRRLFAGILVLGVGATGVAVAQSIVPEGAIGPDNHIQPSGRKLDPPGMLTKLGNHPGGGALTTDGRFMWTLSAGRGRNDIRIVDVSNGAVVQTIPMPGVDGGIAMAPDGRTAYVSGTPESSHKDQQSPAGTPGKGGDVLHVFRYDAATGQATRDGTIGVPPPSGTPVPQALGVPGGFPVGPTIPQNFPPTNTKPISWPRDIAVSGDGSRLLVALNLSDRAAVIDTKSRKVDYVKVGSFPYGAAVTPDGKRGFVSNEADGTVSAIDMDGKSKIKDVQVGTHLSHPEGMAMDPSGKRLYVAVAHQDLIAVVDTSSLKVERTLSVERPQGIGTEPTALASRALGLREARRAFDARTAVFCAFLSSQVFISENSSRILVSAYLDVVDFGRSRYVLEVSSPGLDRQLYKPRDYARFLGSLARVTYRMADGKKRTVVGRLQAFDPEPAPGVVTVVEEPAGEELSLRLEDIQLARLEIEL